MTQPVNASKPVGQQIPTAASVSDQYESQPRPARGPEKPRSTPSVAERKQPVGASHGEETQEALDGDPAEAAMRGQLGMKATGRTSDDAQNPILPTTEPERRAAPIETPSRNFEGEGRVHVPDNGTVQAAPVEAVGGMKKASLDERPVQAQERLIVATSTLDASAIGTLSGSQRFAEFAAVYDREPFVSQRNVLADLMQTQMRTVGRMLG